MKNVVLAILVTILGAVAVMVGMSWIPDTDPAAMKAKYGGPEARYARSADGLDVHYRVSGPTDAPVLIMIHGTSASLHTWEPLRSRLEGGYRVIAYDQPGHGLTGPHPQRDYTYGGMADALDAVFAAEGVEEAILIGNSMGGWVAWRDALENPGRVRALVLIDASGIPATVETKTNLGFSILGSPLGRAAVRKLTPRRVIESSLQGTVAVQEIVTGEMIDRYWELLRYPGNRQAAGDQFSADRADHSDRLGEIEVPTLILWGEEDPLIPVSAAKRFEDAIPGARTIVYRGVGHLPMEEAPDEVAADIAAFLNDEL